MNLNLLKSKNGIKSKKLYNAGKNVKSGLKNANKSGKARFYKLCEFIAPLVLILFTAAACFFVGAIKYRNRVKEYFPIVSKYVEKTGVNAALVFAVIRAESGFDKNAVSKKGAVGLMQIMPETAAYIAEISGYSGEIDLSDPDCNINLGCRYLKYLAEKFKNEKVAVCAYNAGETKVSGWLKNADYSADGKTLKKIPYDETREYYARVQKYKRGYEKYLKRKGYYAKNESERQFICFFEKDALAVYSRRFALRDRRGFFSDKNIL